MNLNILSSDVRDIHDVLEVTVYDEDSAHKSEFLGKVSSDWAQSTQHKAGPGSIEAN